LQANDTLRGEAGDDEIRGDDDQDILFGNTGNDTLDGAADSDTLYGGKGSDSLEGGNNPDQLFGNDGNDTVIGGEGRDTSFGGKNNDSLRGGDGDDCLSGDRGADILWGDRGNDSLLGGADADQLFGGEGGDWLFGNDGPDTIFANEGDDIIFSGAGDDIISGDAGNDVLWGEAGKDIVTGGEGKDVFVINGVSAPNGGSGTNPAFITSGGPDIADADIFTDFRVGEDFIGLSGDLKFEDLVIFQSSDTKAGSAIIRNGVSGDFLAVLPGVDSRTIGRSTFVIAPTIPGSATPRPLPTPTPDPTPTPSPTPTPTPTDSPTPTPTPSPTPPTPTPSPTPVFPTPTASPTPTPTPPTPTLPPTPFPNQFPTAFNDNFTTVAGQPLSLNVLLNDTDPDKNSLTVTTFTATANGQLVASGPPGTFQYTPNPGFAGTDSFSYSISDGQGGSSQAIATINVSSPPKVVINEGVIVAKSNPTQTITAAELLATDPDNSPREITYTITKAPSATQGFVQRGSTFLNVGDTFTQDDINNNIVKYNLLATGSNDSFSFTVSDGFGKVGPSSFSITVVDNIVDRTGLPASSFTGSNLSDYIVGGAGDDSLFGGDGNDIIDGRAGNDQVSGQTGNDSLLGFTGNDTLDGGEGGDSLDGEDGTDSVSGGSGNDTVLGGADNDSVLGDAGDDSLLGGTGLDILQGGAGGDSLDGGAGEDTLDGGLGGDLLDGGINSDSLLGNDNDDTVLGDEGSDTALGGAGNDYLLGEAGSDSMLGEAGDDTLDGGIGSDNLSGGFGSDLVLGGDDNDSLSGGAGNDIVGGGAGSDLLTGDAGDDFFYYETPSEGVDVIVDFNTGTSGRDRFLFRSANFAGLTNSGTTNDFTSFIVRNIGSSGDNISKQEVILFESTFDNAQGVNAVLKNQNGSSKTGAFFVYLNNTFNKYVLGFDPNVADDSLPAFDLGVLTTIPTLPGALSTLITASDFKFI
jgi:Ca2+-binding RTX toxin-like protein